jgi:tetratricopeptide (TPR) repeat protein
LVQRAPDDSPSRARVDCCQGLPPPPPQSGGLREKQVAATRAYAVGKYAETQRIAEELYLLDAARPDNLLLLGAVNFQLRNYSESIFYNQQCIKIDPTCAEAYSNLGKNHE